MKMKLIFVLLLSAFIRPPSAFGQGSLTPPGAPAPTMKTLAQIDTHLTAVEPRTEINAANTPGDADSLFRITQPGSYYISGNITGVSAKKGIKIAVSGVATVTIDLMGFELVGVPGSLDGINSPGSNTGATIRNGTVRGWGGNGIEFFFTSQNNILVNLLVKENGGTGIFTNNRCAVSNCVVSGNSQGISSGYGCTIIECTADGNQGSGISLLDGGTIESCTAIDNGRGFDLGFGTTIIGCTAANSMQQGIRGANSCTVRNCTVSDSTGNGIEVGSGCAVTGCTANDNHLNGIQAGTGSTIIENTCRLNGTTTPTASGIYIPGNRCRIEGNTVTDNGFGIALEASVTGNLVIRNHAAANTTNNYSTPAAGNIIGTLVGTSAAMNAATNSNVNISF